MEVKQNRPISDLAAYVAARQGSEDGLLCNDRARQVVEKYTEVAKEKHGLDFDVMNEPFDPDVVYKAVCGKKHGRHFLADGYIDSWVSASQSRSMSSATVDDIRPPRRIRSPVDRIDDLEAKMDQMHQILLSLQGQLTQNHNNVANNGIAPASTPAGTPGTAGSVGNNRVANFVNAQHEQMDECNNDTGVM